MALHSGLWLFQCATWQALLQYLGVDKVGGDEGRQGKQQQQQHIQSSMHAVGRASAGATGVQWNCRLQVVPRWHT
jgi:hypothetical protein